MLYRQKFDAFIRRYDDVGYITSNSGDTNRVISDELYYSVLDQSRDMGVKRLTLSGGEPLCHPDFLALLRKANDCGSAISVFSNLTLLDDRLLAALNRKIVLEWRNKLQREQTAL